MYEDKIQAGLAWLRSPEAAQFAPDLSRVDLDALDMVSTSQCVLGQAIVSPYGTGYNYVWDTLFFEQGESSGEVDEFMEFHGFKASWLDFDGYRILCQEWREVLTAERASA